MTGLKIKIVFFFLTHNIKVVLHCLHVVEKGNYFKSFFGLMHFCTRSIADVYIPVI